MIQTPVLIFVLESIGTPELIVIAVAALVLFGPRRLPEIGRTLGKSLAEFRRVSDEFKRTWQTEVELEEATSRRQNAPAAATPSAGLAADATEHDAPSDLAAGGDVGEIKVTRRDEHAADADAAVAPGGGEAPALVAVPAESIVARDHVRPRASAAPESPALRANESPEQI